MRGNERLPDDQAEIVFSESFLIYLDNLNPGERESVLAEVVALCDNPIGKHPLSNRSAADRLAGLNTVEVLAKLHRVVFAARAEQGVGLIEVVCAGPRTAEAHLVRALVQLGLLPEDLAGVVSRAEAEAAMRDGDETGQPDTYAALTAVMRAARARSDYGDATDVRRRRSEERCGAEMSRARTMCVRRIGHPGPHRATG
jgi:hypothetical protein